jgi:peptidyl-tRNA hydrolase
VLSIMRTLKSQEFARVRVGVLPVSPSGKVRKPKGPTAVHDYILRTLTKRDLVPIEEAVSRAGEAVRTVLEHGRERAMQDYN